MPTRIKPLDTLANHRRDQLRSTQQANAIQIGQMAEAHRFYYGLNYGQWDDKAVASLRNREAPIGTYNFIRSKLDGLLGAVLDLALEANFETEHGFQNEWGKNLSLMIKYDRSRGKWSRAQKQYYRDGLIHTGWREMFVDYTHSELGNIGMRAKNPAYIYTDPFWQTDDVNDARFIQIVAWLTAEQIKDTYNTKSGEIDELIREYNHVSKYGTLNSEDVIRHFDRTPEFYDQKTGRYLVIQTVELKRTKKLRYYNLNTGKPEEFMDPAFAEFRMRHLGEQYNIVSLPHTECVIDAVAPAISTTLNLLEENTLHPVQIGRYPYFTWSAYNLYGERSGIVELLKDAQSTYNKRESLITFEMGTNSSNVEFYDEDTFPDDKAERKYLEQGNIPGTKIKTRAGKMPQPRKRDSVRQELYQSKNDMLGFSNIATAAGPALLGQEGKSGESGKLFVEKRGQALVQLLPFQESLMGDQQDWAESYYYLAKQVYSDVYRRIVADGQAVELNKPMPDGRIINDIATIPRMAVRITMGRGGISQKRETLTLAMEASQNVSSPSAQIAYQKLILENIPNLTEEEKKEAREALDLELKVLKARANAEIMQVEQMTQGPTAPGQTPAEGGGLSMEGKQIKPEAGLPFDVRAQNQLG